MSERIANIDIWRRRHERFFALDDAVVIEEPLEIRIAYGQKDNRQNFTLSITMRTPGEDADLVRGFLFTEGIIQSNAMISEIVSSDVPGNHSVTVHLHPEVPFMPEEQQRHFYTTSSCGVCGKASIDMVRQVTSYRLAPGVPQIPDEMLKGLATQMHIEQSVFRETGGIHAAALFNASGQLLQSREDIGRHNAVDKLIGWALDSALVPLDQLVMVVSGRAGFELVQKASMAGVPFFAAVGAPSSLAVELARECDMTLVGFLKRDGFNIYAHPGRVSVPPLADS